MSNQLVALLLVVCLVTVQGETYFNGKKPLTQAECVANCISRSILWKSLSESLCEFNCANVITWKSYQGPSSHGSHARGYGPVGAPKPSLAPAPRSIMELSKNTEA
ncbi:unnamed protein product [Lathyrus sativus]|nr:unnamed protein product [Lathyrus sativus]